MTSRASQYYLDMSKKAFVDYVNHAHKIESKLMGAKRAKELEEMITNLCALKIGSLVSYTYAKTEPEARYNRLVFGGFSHRFPLGGTLYARESINLTVEGFYEHSIRSIFNLRNCND